MPRAALVRLGAGVRRLLRRRARRDRAVPARLRGSRDEVEALSSAPLLPMSPLPNHVGGVVCCGPRKEMRRVHAWRVVATVTRAEFGWQRAEPHLERDSMRVHQPAVAIDVTVPVPRLSPEPQPAFLIGPTVNLLPKPRFERAGTGKKRTANRTVLHPVGPIELFAAVGAGLRLRSRAIVGHVEAVVAADALPITPMTVVDWQWLPAAAGAQPARLALHLRTSNSGCRARRRSSGGRAFACSDSSSQLAYEAWERRR